MVMETCGESGAGLELDRTAGIVAQVERDLSSGQPILRLRDIEPA